MRATVARLLWWSCRTDWCPWGPAAPSSRRGGELVACRGWGYADADRGVEADCGTAYDVVSMTKRFTAAAVLRLQMDGELAVTDRITRFFPDAPADKRAITVQHLLTHTAGLPEGLGGDYEPLTRADVADARAQLFEPRVREEPGGASFDGYGWVAQQTSLGPVRWHDGGDGWNLDRRGSRMSRDLVEWLLAEE